MTRLNSPASTRALEITIRFDGRPVQAHAGETIAGALLAAGYKSWRVTPGGHPRGLFCGIGLCFDCLVTVDGRPNVRACQTPVADGMVIETGNARGET